MAIIDSMPSEEIDTVRVERMHRSISYLSSP